MTSAPIVTDGIAWRSTFLRELLARMHGDATEIRVLGDLSTLFKDFRDGPQDFFFPEEGRQIYYPVRVRAIQKEDENLATNPSRSSQGLFDLTELLRVLRDDGRSVLLEAGTGAGKTVACLAAMFDCLHPDPELPGSKAPRLAGYLPCPIRRFPDLDPTRLIVRAIAEASGIHMTSQSRPDWLNRIQDWYLASLPLLLFVDLNDVAFDRRLRVAEGLIEFLDDKKNEKHRAVVTYRDHAEDATIAALRVAKLRFRRPRPIGDPGNKFYDQENMFCRISLDPMETRHAQSYLTNLRRIEAGYLGRPVDEPAVLTETKILDELIRRFAPGRDSILNTPMMLYFVGNLGAKTLEHAATPAALYDAVVEKILDRESAKPRRTMTPSDVRIAMGRLALAILATGRTHLASPERNPDQAFRTLDRIFSAPKETAHLRGEKWIDRYWVGGIYTIDEIKMPSSRQSSKDHSERIFVRWSNREFAFVHDSYLYYFAACVLRCPKDPLRESGVNVLDAEWREAVVRWWGEDPERWKETAEFLGGMLSFDQVRELALDLIVASSGPGWPELARRLIRGHGPVQESSLLRALADAIDNKGALQPGGEPDIEEADPRSQRGLAPGALFSEVYHFLRDGMVGDELRDWADWLSERRQRPWIRADPVTSPTHWPLASYLHGSAVHDLVLDGDDLVFVDGSGRLWRRDQERVHTIATAPRGSVRFAISGDGKTLVGSADDGQVWRIRAGGVLEKLYRHKGIRALAVSRDGTVVVSGGRQRTIFRWVDQAGGSSRPKGDHSHEAHSLPGPVEDEVTAIVTNTQGTIVLSGGLDGGVYRSEYWPDGFVKQEKLYTHRDLVTSITITRDGRTIASGDKSGKVYRLGPPREIPEEVYNHRGELISAIAMCDHGKVIVTGGDPSVFRFVMDVDHEPSHIHDHDGQVVAISVSDNGEAIVSADKQGVIRRADGRTRNPALSRHRNDVNAVVVSDDGQFIFTGGADGAVHRASRAGIEPWRGDRHDSPVRWLALGRDGQFLVVYLADGVVRRLTEGDEDPTPLRCDPKAVFAAVSGDGRTLAFLGSDGTIRRAEFGDVSTQIIHEASDTTAIETSSAPDPQHVLKNLTRQEAGPDAIDLQGGLDPADRGGELFATAAGWSIRLIERRPTGEVADVTAFLCRQDVTALAIARDHTFLVAGLRNGQVLHLWIMQSSSDRVASKP